MDTSCITSEHVSFPAATPTDILRSELALNGIATAEAQNQFEYKETYASEDAEKHSHSEQPAKRARAEPEDSTKERAENMQAANVGSDADIENHEVAEMKTSEHGQVRKPMCVSTASPLLKLLLQCRLLEDNHMLQDGPCCGQYCMFRWEVDEFHF